MRAGAKKVHVSVVSHGQAALVQRFLNGVEKHIDPKSVVVTLTLNIPETIEFSQSDFSYPLNILKNAEPKGFGANHNAAFRSIREADRSEFFCVANPDIELEDDALSPLIAMVSADKTIGIGGPLVKNSLGLIEDSARRLPTPVNIFRRAVGRRSLDYDMRAPVVYPDWIAGMFMVFPKRVFKELGGFDERYFLYYEDVDICSRARLQGYRIAVNTASTVVHDARRSSHCRISYLRRHLRSMTRFFSSKVFFDVRRKLVRVQDGGR